MASVAKVFSLWQTLEHLAAPGVRVPSEWATVLDQQVLLENVVMVIELVFGDGRRFRVSTVPIRSSSSANGSNHDTLPLLISEPEIKSSIRLKGSVSASRALTMTLPPGLVDPADFMSRGLMLAGFGEVSLQVDGGDYDRRYVIMRGEMSGGVRFGAFRSRGDEEMMEVEVVDPKTSTSVRIPEILIDPEVFTDAHPTAVGKRIPIVLGRYDAIPGVRFNGSGASLPDFAFAMGHGWTVDKVYVNGVGKIPADASYGFSVVEGQTSQVQAYSYINFTNIATVWKDGDTVYVEATHSTEEGGFNLISAIQALLQRHGTLGAGLNDALFGTAEPKVPDLPIRVMVNGSGRQGSDIIRYIETGLLKTFPMVKMVWEGGGYGPVVVDARSAPVTRLEAGGFLLFDRTSMVREMDKESIYNDFVLRYNYDPLLDAYRSVISRNPTNDQTCRASEDQVGALPYNELESPYIFDDAMAGYVVDWMVFHFGIPSYYVEYEGSARLFFLLRRGDTIELEDGDFGWDGERAVVETISYRRGRCLIGFRVWARYWLRV